MQLKAILYFILLLAAPNLHAATQWTGSLPKKAQSPKHWIDLIHSLYDNGHYYGALAASVRGVYFFSDLSTKQTAFQTIVKLIDHGYPHDTHHLFRVGDIEPVEENHFSQAYNFYKAMLNRDEGTEKWASYYFQNIDKENFSKYKFYQALQAYQDADLRKAEELTKSVINLPLDTNNASLIRKASRTLARIYFEQERYSRSLDIYQSYLLKMNPIKPSDWLETAWNFYHLKQYNLALGMLFNLESRSLEPRLQLEKYVLRALIYRDNCSLDAMKSLSDSFDADFGKVLTGIKTGVPLQKYRALNYVYHPENNDYFQIKATYDGLLKEYKKIKLPSKLRGLARYLYRSEARLMKRRIKLYRDKASELAAQHLVTLSENIKFLTFDVEKERFNPDTIFVTKEDNRSFVEDTGENKFLLRWPQTGDYWRDERNEYKGNLEDKCSG